MAFELILPFFPESLQVLILNDQITDLCINGSTGVFVERDGIMSRVEGLSMGMEQLNAAIEQIARVLGKDITEQDPILDTRLPNGSRVAAVYPPCSPGGATVTIRKFNHWFSSDQLVSMGSLPCGVRDVIVDAILDRRNVLISGGTGSGKSTMLNALIAHIPPNDRLVVIEKPMELEIKNQNAVRWEAVDALPGRTAKSVAQLVVASLVLSARRPPIAFTTFSRSTAIATAPAASPSWSGSAVTTAGLIHSISSISMLRRRLLNNIHLSHRQPAKSGGEYAACQSIRSGRR